MKLIVDEMPYFTNECPFEGDDSRCRLSKEHCSHFDVPCRERNQDECDGLITLEAYEKKRTGNN